MKLPKGKFYTRFCCVIDIEQARRANRWATKPGPLKTRRYDDLKTVIKKPPRHYTRRFLFVRFND
ncbi:hypothetical protein GCM10009347_04230 [Shewanella algicola]|nr:hypothetical protein GCM10009347_04230 [Shewanella algicola]